MTINEEAQTVMSGLKTQWGILKDDKKTKKERTVACGKVCKLSEQAKEAIPDFEVIDMNNTKYAEFLPSQYVSKSDVNWGDTITMDSSEMEALKQLQRLESIAVDQIKIKLPKERTDSQKFGMIVSAYTEKLVQLYIHANN